MKKFLVVFGLLFVCFSASVSAHEGSYFEGSKVDEVAAAYDYATAVESNFGVSVRLDENEIIKNKNVRWDAFFEEVYAGLLANDALVNEEDFIAFATFNNNWIDHFVEHAMNEVEGTKNQQFAQKVSNFTFDLGGSAVRNLPKDLGFGFECQVTNATIGTVSVRIDPLVVIVRG